MIDIQYYTMYMHDVARYMRRMKMIMIYASATIVKKNDQRNNECLGYANDANVLNKQTKLIKDLKLPYWSRTTSMIVFDTICDAISRLMQFNVDDCSIFQVRYVSILLR